MYEAADDLARPVAEPRRDRDNGSLLADKPADGPDELSIGKGLRANSVNSQVCRVFATLHGQPGQVVNINRLEFVPTLAKDGKHGQVAQCPSDVVNQDVFFAEEDGGSQDGVG